MDPTASPIPVIIEPYQLDQCITYFTSGGIMEWVGGGVMIACALILAFTKKNVPAVMKDAGVWMMDFAKKKRESEKK